MQITFDTNNPKDLEILSTLLLKFPSRHHPHGGDTQPEVVNTGSAVAETPQSDADSAVSEAAQAAPAPVKPKRGRTKPEIRDEGNETAPIVEEATPAVVAVEEAAPTKPVSIDDVRAALQAYTGIEGVPAGIDLLKRFGAARISELKVEDYAAFIEACQ